MGFLCFGIRGFRVSELPLRLGSSSVRSFIWCFDYKGSSRVRIVASELRFFALRLCSDFLWLLWFWYKGLLWGFFCFGIRGFRVFESSASFRLFLGRVRTPYRCLVSGFCLVRLLASVVGRVSLFDLSRPCFFTLCNGSLLFSVSVLWVTAVLK